MGLHEVALLSSPGLWKTGFCRDGRELNEFESEASVPLGVLGTS